MPETKVSGCPAGQTAPTVQPCRSKAPAIRADEGHHFVASTNTLGWDLSKAEISLNQSQHRLQPFNLTLFLKHGYLPPSASMCGRSGAGRNTSNTQYFNGSTTGVSDEYVYILRPSDSVSSSATLCLVPRSSRVIGILHGFLPAICFECVGRPCGR